ncbi:hypothetical protein J2858_002239 [Neorhizobium galegae]|uniref:hypothetical protein n=1 Tax=Neorhizobium galegae TaxID=399 RepID=UPI001AE8D89A|nr:hypothetical protein [Neorhizobium galegae]MBP2549316.1 hypothetical protein [Neorhizobium galegae]
MRMLDVLKSATQDVGQIGSEERSKARALGVSSFYADQQGRVIEEFPDGRKAVVAVPIGETGADAAE